MKVGATGILCRKVLCSFFMKKEVIKAAATVEEAIQLALAELNVTQEACEVEILQAPKKSLFGKLKSEASVKVSTEIPDVVETVENEKLTLAKAYLRQILDAMGLRDVTLKIKEHPQGATISFRGDGIAVLIGHHGETLDALQYLIALTCNRSDGVYYRISLDCGSYRDKREATLTSLAQRISAKVKATGRSQMLEPMNPYERRIIHAVVSEIEGVSSKSRGDDPNRKVVITSTAAVKTVEFKKNLNRKEDAIRPNKPYKQERTMEEILKSDFKETEKSAELYSKIDV